MPDTATVKRPSIDPAKLTTAQKLRLIERLWDSIDEADLPPISRAEAAELDRRIAELDSGKVRAVPLAKAMRQLRSSIRKRSR